MPIGSMRFARPTSTGLAMERLELNHRRLDRARGGLTQAAYGRVAHRLRDVAQQHDVGLPIAVALAQHPLEDLLLSLRAHAARHALSARFVAEEPRDAQQDWLHVCRVVEHDDGAGPERRADRTRALEAERHVELSFGHERTGGAPPQHSPQLPALAHAARELDECP